MLGQLQQSNPIRVVDDVVQRINDHVTLVTVASLSKDETSRGDVSTFECSHVVYPSSSHVQYGLSHGLLTHYGRTLRYGQNVVGRLGEATGWVRD